VGKKKLSVLSSNFFKSKASGRPQDNLVTQKCPLLHFLKRFCIGRQKENWKKLSTPREFHV
jgi:hypothetical protein